MSVGPEGAEVLTEAPFPNRSRLARPERHPAAVTEEYRRAVTACRDEVTRLTTDLPASLPKSSLVRSRYRCMYHWTLRIGGRREKERKRQRERERERRGANLSRVPSVSRFSKIKTFHFWSVVGVEFSDGRSSLGRSSL